MKQQHGDSPSLLLLPYPPFPASRHSIDVAYRPPITAVLSKLKRPERTSRLVIAVPSPIIHGQFRRQKTIPWPEAQSLVAAIYALVSAVCSHLSIATDVGAGPGSVDATVVLVDHDHARRLPSDSRPAVEPNNTVVVDLASFASAYYPWDLIFHVTSEAGIRLFQTYLTLYEGRQKLLQDQLVSVPGGLVMNIAGETLPAPVPRANKPNAVCIGGTFDHLHPGHKLLLTAGALLLNVPGDDGDDGQDSARPARVIIGVSADELLKNKKFADYVESWDARARNVITFLSSLINISSTGWKTAANPDILEKEGDFSASFRDGQVTVQCVALYDLFGPTAALEDIDILVVSGETRSGGAAVNNRRRELGWHELDVYEVDVLDTGDNVSIEPAKGSESFAAKISSTAIRQQRAASSSKGEDG